MKRVDCINPSASLRQVRNKYTLVYIFHTLFCTSKHEGLCLYPIYRWLPKYILIENNEISKVLLAVNMFRQKIDISFYGYVLVEWWNLCTYIKTSFSWSTTSFGSLCPYTWSKKIESICSNFQSVPTRFFSFSELSWLSSAAQLLRAWNEKNSNFDMRSLWDLSQIQSIKYTWRHLCHFWWTICFETAYSYQLISTKSTPHLACLT